MGACVTPAKQRYPKVPLPSQNTNMTSQQRPNTPSTMNPDNRYMHHSNAHSQKEVTLGNIPPGAGHPINHNSMQNPQSLNHSNYLLQSQKGLPNIRRPYSIDPIPQQASSSVRRISDEMSISPRNLSTNTRTQTININPGNFPPIIRKESTTHIKQQLQPSSIANSVQAMVDTYNVPGRNQTPNFRGSAVNRLQEVISYESKELPFQPPPPHYPFPSTIPVMHTQTNMHQPPMVDKRLLSFDKNTFRVENNTPIPQSFRYNISLPMQKDIMF